MSPTSGVGAGRLESSTLGTPDGARLRYAVAHPRGTPRGTVLVLPGRSEFVEKYDEVSARLVTLGYRVVVLDWRGQGRSTRILARRERGHVASFVVHLADLSELFTRVVCPLGPEPVVFMGHSMGAHVGLRYLHDHPGAAARAIWSAPMVAMCTPKPRPLVRRAVHWLVRFGAGELYVPHGTDFDPATRVYEGNDVTTDPARFARAVELMASDRELALGAPTLGWVEAAFASEEVLARPGYVEAIDLPTLVLTAERDTVVSNAAQTSLCERLPNARQVLVPGAQHEIFQETDAIQAVAWAAIENFLATPPHNLR